MKEVDDLLEKIGSNVTTTENCASEINKLSNEFLGLRKEEAREIENLNKEVNEYTNKLTTIFSELESFVEKKIWVFVVVALVLFVVTYSLILVYIGYNQIVLKNWFLGLILAFVFYFSKKIVNNAYVHVEKNYKTKLRIAREGVQQSTRIANNLLSRDKRATTLMGSLKREIMNIVAYVKGFIPLLDDVVRLIDKEKRCQNILESIQACLKRYGLYKEAGSTVEELKKNLPVSDDKVSIVEYYLERISESIRVNLDILKLIYYDFIDDVENYRRVSDKISGNEFLAKELCDLLGKSGVLKIREDVFTTVSLIQQAIRTILNRYDLKIGQFQLYIDRIAVVLKRLKELYGFVENEGFSLKFDISQELDRILNAFRPEEDPLSHGRKLYEFLFDFLMNNMVDDFNLDKGSVVRALLVLSTQGKYLEEIACKEAARDDDAIKLLIVYEDICKEIVEQKVKFRFAVEEYVKNPESRVEKYRQEYDLFKAKLNSGKYYRDIPLLTYEALEKLQREYSEISNKFEEVIKEKRKLEKAVNIMVSPEAFEKILASKWILSYLITWSSEPGKSGAEILEELKRKYPEKYHFEKYTNNARLGIIVKHESFIDFVNDFKSDLKNLGYPEEQLPDFIVHAFGRSRYSVEHTYASKEPEAFRILRELLAEKFPQKLLVIMLYGGSRIKEIFGMIDVYDVLLGHLKKKEKKLLKKVREEITNGLLKEFDISVLTDIVDIENSKRVEIIANILRKYTNNRLPKNRCRRLAELLIKELENIAAAEEV